MMRGKKSRVLQFEAGILAADLEALEAEGVEPELLEELETAGVESAAEALVSMREARTKINEVKRDRLWSQWKCDVSIQTSWQPSEPCQSHHKVF